MQSTTHINIHSAGTVAASLGRRWPVLALGICALLALAILVGGVLPVAAAPARQEKPTFDTADPLTIEVQENTPSGDPIGDSLPAANDGDGDPLTYTLAGTDRLKFDFNGDDRQIFVGQSTTLDFEREPASYSVTLQVTDNKNDQGIDETGNVIDATIEINIKVTDVDEPPDRPAAPTVHAGDTDGDTTLAISWTAPDNAGRPDISDYDVQYRAGSGDFTDAGYDGTGTSTAISDLDPSTEYQVQVRAKNDEGIGPWSDSGNGQTGSATTPCETLDIDQDDTAPGATVDLTFRLKPDGCSPGELTSEITIFLHEDIGFPSGFDQDDVRIIAGTRFTPVWADDSMGTDEPHEIELPGCQAWRLGSSDPGVCEDANHPVVIQLENFRLPAQRDTPDDPYEVAIQWDGGMRLPDNVAVYATLEVDGDDEVGYGETIRFQGLGFSDGLTVDLYAARSDGSAGCATAGGGGWTRIGSAEVGSDHRFRADVEVVSSLFRSAGRHQICARDGGGVFNNTSLPVVITAGLEVSGSSEVSPGGEVTLRIVGGSGSRVDEVLVAGQTLNRSQWNQSGDTLRVTLPPRHSGRVTIAARLNGSSELVTVNVTIRDADLSVHPDTGLGLGERFTVRSNDLAGDEVCEVTLGGIRLAFLDDGQDDVRSRNDCPEVIRGGRFLGAVALVNEDGDINSDLISKLLESDGEEKLEITDSAGVKASATVKVTKPTLTVDPDEGEVSPGDYIVFRGKDFPAERGYYDPPSITVEINGRIAKTIYTTSGTWDFEYRVPSRAEGGESIRPLVKINGYPLHDLTLDLDLVVTPGKLAIEPSRIAIGQPITVRLFGLDRFIGGYSVQLRNGPSLGFDGRASFASDGSGEFTGITVIPEDYHQDFAARRDYPATLQVYQGRDRLPGVVETVTLLPERYVPPTFAPDAPAAPAVAADGPFGLTVTWTEPFDDGGAPITDYDVEYGVAGSRVYADAGYSGPGASHTLTGLAQGTEYQVRVRANNAAGTSEWSRPATGATEQLVASIEAAPDTGSVVAGEPAGFRITLSHAADVTVRLTHETDGGFGTDGSGECVITGGAECVYSVDTSESQDSDPGSLTVTISPAAEYAVGTPSARVIIQNPAPTPTPVPPTPTPTPEPTATPEPTDTPIPPPPTIDQGALTSTIVAAVATGETETRDRPIAEEETDGGGLSGLAIGLIGIAALVVLITIGAVVTLVMRRRDVGGAAGGGGDTDE